MKEYLDMWKNYANFKGRTSVRGYWMAFLFNVLAGIIIGIITSIIGVSFLSSLYSLAALVPGLAITVRRLQDAGCKWTAIFLSLIPFVGAILLIIKLCMASAPEEVPAPAEL